MRVAVTASLLVATGCSGVELPTHTIPDNELEGLRTGTLVAFTPSDDLLPSVSSDGRFVLFASEQNGNLDIWVRDFGSNSTYPITKSSSADDYDPNISPDGQRMAFVTRRLDAKGDVFISDANDESDIERVTDERTHDRQPTWSPTQDAIYFTAALGIEEEYIARVDLDSKAVERISPGGGFDPAPSPDGQYLVYTEPGEHPHLVALRLATGATVAITHADSPEGFAAFVPPQHVANGGTAIVYVRFPDDDNGDGIVDAHDHASIWRLDLDLDAIFDRRSAPPDPIPLTDGSDDELFPTAADGGLYVTRGVVQQDVVRYPLDGMFPPYDDPEDYLRLADVVEDPRTEWFVLRIAEAKAAPGGLFRAQVALRIANLQLSRARPDLAELAFRRVLEQTKDATPESPGAQLAGLARVELVAIDHDRRLAAASSDLRDAVLDATQADLEAIRSDYAWADRVVARVDLELAELLVDRGKRVLAIEALDRVVAQHPTQTFSAARASLRRIELLSIAHDPSAIGDAYGAVLKRWPDQRDVVREAATRIVDAHLDDLGVGGDWTDEVDALRRIIPRYGVSVVRLEARWRLARLLESHGVLDAAALEYEQIIAASTDDRLGAARAMVALHTINELRGRLDEASSGWRALGAKFGELPGFASQAREAITRVNLERAQREERRGNRDAAIAAYKRVIDNDLTQIKAHRRYLALSSEIGRIDDALEEAKTRAERSSSTPIARYAYGLALTWADPPEFDAAWDEIEEAIRLNPQLANAYVTRGWIRERRERKPGFFKRAAQTIVQTVGQMIGGLLDVEIGKQGELELAIEDYKTALRLNSESTAPEAEAEILLNLGNAHYTLAEKTQDVSNMRVAFDRYAQMLRFGYRFYDPVAEALFWERFGRSAIWADEPALSAMATRRAIGFVKRIGMSSRLAQLYGNLALAYANAGEDAYARRALAQFDDALRKRNLEERLIIAVRDRARSRLLTLEARSTESLDHVLRELATSRSLLAETESTPRDPPDLWRGAISNHTSAQYGFRPIAELDVNLALAEITHDAHGERSRALELRRRRLAVSDEVLDTIPTVLGVQDSEPVALLQVRERLGLIASEARAALRRGDVATTVARYDAALAELDRWRADARIALDRDALEVDRGRLVASRVEALVELGQPVADQRAALEAMRDSILVELTPTKNATTGALLLTNPLLDELPTSITSTLALVQTASVAMRPPTLTGPMLDARAVRARLAHAQGLVALDAAHRALRGASELEDLLRSLDGEASEAMVRAHRAFEIAAREAAGAGPGVGGRVFVSALLGLAYTTSAASAAARSLDAALVATAREVAERIGRPDLSAAVMLADAARHPGRDAAVDTALRERGPHVFVPSRRAYERLLARRVEAAVEKGDAATAVGVVDRWLLVSGASATPVELHNRAATNDSAASLAYRRRLDRLESLRDALLTEDVTTATEDHVDRMDRIREAVGALREFEELAAVELSEVAFARLFRVPQAPEFVASDVRPQQIIVAPVPVRGLLHLAIVDGSTTAEQLAVVPTEVPFAEARAALLALNTSLASGVADPAAIELLRAAITTPLAERLASKREILFAPALLGGPIPAIVAERGGRPIGVTHLSAPSALTHSLGVQLVGVEGKIVVGRPDAPPLVDDGRRLDPEEAFSFRRGDQREKLEVQETRVLDERNAVQRFAARSLSWLVVEAELALEPNALERSAFRVRTSTSRDGSLESAAADAFGVELPLAGLDMPARTLVLGQLSRADLGGQPYPHEAALALDLPLAVKGFATTLLVPSSVSAPTVRRIVEAVLREGPRRGAARALAAAIAEVRSTDAAADLVTLVGAPGLDAKDTRAHAEDQVRAARTYAIDRLKKKRYEEVVPALERWIRLQFEAKEPKYVKSAYLALIGVLSDQLEDHDRAVDAMEALVAYMEAEASDRKDERQVADATVDLAYLYSRAHDYPKAEATFERAIARLEKLGEREGVARAWFKLARHYREKLDFERATADMERAIALYEKLGQYAPGAKRKSEADLALEQVGDLYLNSLSDPVRAQRAYERAIRYARDDAARIDGRIDLARVARRRGDFDAATEHAAAARAAAAEKGLGTREMSGIIEEANVAWYRGDYERGRVLCRESLELATRFYQEIAKPAGDRKGDDKVPSKRAVQNLEIYARSVCGLVAMSRRDFDGAVEHLGIARRIAEAIDKKREVATQYNNLGRVYLEFGRLGDATEAFRAALAIDTKLEDRYALAYDLRNLGRALTLEKVYAEAKEALEKGLAYAIEAKDTNNELRARFALAQLAEAIAQPEIARRVYEQALPLAERLDVKDLAWQIHHALGRMARDAGRLDDAERSLQRAVAIARTMTGRAGSADGGPDRFVAFDDLMSLLLDGERVREAFEVANSARALQQVAVLDDARVRFGDGRGLALLSKLRSAASATVAAAALDALDEAAPRLAEIVRPVDVDALAAQLPEDAAVLVYELTAVELTIFVLRRGADALTVRRVASPDGELARRVRQYAQRLVDRADLTTDHAYLHENLVKPVADQLSGVRRIAFVLDGPLRYVALPALPFDGERAIVDAFVTSRALHVRGAARGLTNPMPALGAELPLAAFGAPTVPVGSTMRPLAFADKEVLVIREEYPRADVVRGAAVTRDALAGALATSPGVFHFAGHSFLAGGRGELVDPLGGRLRTSGEDLQVLDVLALDVRAKLVVLSACFSMLAPFSSQERLDGDEVMSFAQAFHLAGADHVLATSSFVDDLSASILVKRFYRAAKESDAATALAEAQREVRARHPHPAWWATYALVDR